MSTLLAMAEPGIDIKTALHRIEMHEKVCTERHGNIWQALNDLKTAVANVQTSVSDGSTQQHSRLDTLNANHTAQFAVISNRMWGLLVWVSGSSVLGLGTLCFYLMTHK